MSGYYRKTGRLFLTLLFCLLTVPAFAQRKLIPTERYFDGYRLLRRGNIAQANDLYRSELRSSIQVGSVRWIDSICYYAMLGETCWIGGDIPAALSAYESAIDLALENRDWLTRVSYATPPSTAVRRAAPWGGGTRNAPTGVFPNYAMIQIGDPISEERLRQGGAMSSPELHRIEPIEIIRCTALALRRRLEILGPLAPFDPRSERILECFSTRSVAANHWSVTWLDVMFGLALAGTGKTAEAQNILNKSLLMGGNYEHHLTAAALLALGDLYLADLRPNEALTCFFEASISAWQFDDSLLIGEALEKYVAAGRAVSRSEDIQPLMPALHWASSPNGSSFLTMILLLETAENFLLTGRTQEAAVPLRNAETLIRSSGLTASRFADRWDYINALAQLSAGAASAGSAALNRAIAGSPKHLARFYQLRKLNGLVVSGERGDLSPRAASDLYQMLLRTPDHYDWSCAPLESLAVETLISADDFSNWFLLLLDRDLVDQAFEVAEIAKRKRYFSRLEYGGRAFAFRTLFEAAPGDLSNDLRVLRQNILLENPAYAKLSEKAASLKTRIRGLPMTPEKDSDVFRSRNELLLELQKTGAAQESLLLLLSAQRIPLPPLFPPVYSAAQIRDMVPPGETLLSFFEVRGEIYGFMLAGGVTDVWRVDSTAALAERISAFLKTIGSSDANRARLIKEIDGEKAQAWKKSGATLLAALLGDPKSGAVRFNVKFERLAIVPDSVLWYLPFEALSLPNDGDLTPLAAVPGLTVRYAPLASTAYLPGKDPGKNPFAETLIVSGPLFGKEGKDEQTEAIKRLERVVPKPSLYPADSMEVPLGIAAFRIPELIVLREIAAPGPDWSLFAVGKSVGDTLDDWVFLPWGAPETIVLPGFRSAAENGLKNGGDGSEFFFPLLTLQARGNRTIFMSRWRTGGRSAYDLTESFLSNLAQQTPPDAWKSAVEAFRAAPLNLKEEPRFRGSVPAEAPLGEHPFFWAGYMPVWRSEKNPEAPEIKQGAEAEKDQDAEENPGDAADEAKEGPEPKEGEEPKEGGESKKEDAGSPKDSDVKKPAADQKETEKESDGEEPSDAIRPLTPKPITDEEIQRADEEADDFYAPPK